MAVGFLVCLRRLVGVFFLEIWGEVIISNRSESGMNCKMFASCDRLLLSSKRSKSHEFMAVNLQSMFFTWECFCKSCQSQGPLFYFLLSFAEFVEHKSGQKMQCHIVSCTMLLD